MKYKNQKTINPKYFYWIAMSNNGHFAEMKIYRKKYDVSNERNYRNHIWSTDETDIIAKFDALRKAIIQICPESSNNWPLSSYDTQKDIVAR